MSQTRAEVFSLLKQFDQEFILFDGVEESFVLDLIRDDMQGTEQPKIDWQRLSKATFALPHLYIQSRQRLLSDAPEWFIRQAKCSYLQLVSSNEDRLVQIQELSHLFENAGLKVIFLKGAAELSYSPNDTDFFGRRQMCDIDLLCDVKDLASVDELLRSNGHKLWDQNLKHWSEEKIRQFTLDKYSHYIYNAYSRTYMELHGYVAVGANRASYPPGFERLLLEQSRQINVRDTKVWVPKPEHLLVYALCHAASSSNNRQLIYLDRFHLDDFAATDCALSPPLLLNKRLDVSQLRFLLQLKDLLIRFEGRLDFREIGDLLSAVPEKELSEMYACAASFIFARRFPVVDGASFETMRAARQRYVSRFMLPLLAERIESIIAGRLEEMAAVYMEREIERIATSVERRVVQHVTERVIDSAKSFVRKRLLGLFAAPFQKTLRRSSN